MIKHILMRVNKLNRPLRIIHHSGERISLTSEVDLGVSPLEASEVVVGVGVDLQEGLMGCLHNLDNLQVRVVEQLEEVDSARSGLFQSMGEIKEVDSMRMSLSQDREVF